MIYSTVVVVIMLNQLRICAYGVLYSLSTRGVAEANSVDTG